MKDLKLDDLKGFTKEKKELLKQMYSLSQEQSKKIEDEQFEKLEEVLDKKDKIIEEIDGIDLKFKKSSQEKQIEDKELLEILADIKKILLKVKALDDMNNKKLSDAMANMKGDIKDMRQGMRAMQNYGNSDPYQAFASQGGTLFIDQDS